MLAGEGRGDTAAAHPAAARIRWRQVDAPPGPSGNPAPQRAELAGDKHKETVVPNPTSRFALACTALAAGLALAACSTPAVAPQADAAKRPNILLIVADDLGFNDLGITGSEIRTPNLDALAQRSVVMTDFHSAPTCSPTRSMLMTGVDNHQAGLGEMAERKKAPNQADQPAYAGHLDARLVTIAEQLQDRGYNTYMAGKWHLGKGEGREPATKGFDDSFVLLQGGGSHFANMLGYQPIEPVADWRDNGKPVTKLPDDFFSSTAVTERMLGAIERNRGNGKPFFGYLAYTAPHWPLQVPDGWLERYKGRYDAGYEALWRERHARLQRLGLVAADAPLPPFPSHLKKWDELTPEQRRVEARTTELYAAMVEHMDDQIGRLLARLKAIGEYDNTLIVFMSDNGADADNVRGIWARYGEDKARAFEQKFDFSYGNMGRPGSFVVMTPGWTPARALPSRLHKGFTSEGGIRVPAMIKYPGKDGRTGRSGAFASVLDLPATFLALAGEPRRVVARPGRVVPQPLGSSMLPFLQQRTASVHGPDYVMGWELSQHKAVRKGDWKLLRLDAPFKTADWQLFNLAKDPGETRDLAAEQPEKLREMIQAYQQYAASAGVIDPVWPPAAK